MKMRISNFILIVLLTSWLFVGGKMVLEQIKMLRIALTGFMFIAEEQKLRVIDGNFYDFMKYCVENIPRDNDIGFVLTSNPKIGTKTWFKTEYFIQRAPYYLYPIKVFRKEYRAMVKYLILYDIERSSFLLRKE